MSEIKAVCFGEVLVDQFPAGDKPGGAPMNVAYHLSNLGTLTAVVSSVGVDEIGAGLIAFMNSKGLNTDLIQHHPKLRSGTVQVDVSDKNEAKYSIIEPVAWDDIMPVGDLTSVENADFIVHGSLALRSEQNRTTLKKLKERLNAKSVFDLNLRPPFFSKELLLDQMKESNIVKLNEEEFAMISEWLEVAADEKGLKSLMTEFPNLEIILVTFGGKGAWLQTNDQLIKSKSYSVTVKETVGAGDSFLGAFIHGLVNDHSLEDSVNLACATGALVASKSGANPAYSIQDVNNLMNP